MSRPPQDKFRSAAKKALVDRDLTVTALSVRIGKARNTVSQAINHPILPTVRRLIAKDLKLEAYL